jgi:hypothetical protein
VLLLPATNVFYEDTAHHRAYVANFVSRNVSVVDLAADAVVATIVSAALPAPSSSSETNLVGAEMFFSSRGSFDPIAGFTNSLRNRLSSEGWQACASCHFKGLTDGVVNNPGNAYYVLDGAKWLLGDEALTGEISSEVDTPVAHTRKQDVTWFWGTIVLAPGLALALGRRMTRRRSSRSSRERGKEKP